MSECGTTERMNFEANLFLEFATESTPKTVVENFMTNSSLYSGERKLQSLFDDV